jgi:hypothetical protein
MLLRRRPPYWGEGLKMVAAAINFTSRANSLVESSFEVANLVGKLKSFFA